MTGFLDWLKGLFVRPNTRIMVRINFDKDGSCWHYDLEADDHQSQKFVKPGNKIDFPHGQPTSIIEFRLQGKAGQQLDFDLSDPIWLNVGGCPTGFGSIPTEFEVLPTSSANRLHLQNKNLDQADVHYRLNFLDTSGNKVSWDPIIRNGGGGGP